VACNKEVEQLLSSSNAEAVHSWSLSRCAVISLLGIGAWIVVEYDDEPVEEIKGLPGNNAHASIVGF
jgi:hypothetical protein